MTDPYRLLSVSTDADDSAVRAAYIAAIRACPPERDSHRFELIRAAFEAIATERGRASHALFDTGVTTAAEVAELLSAGWRPGRPGLQALRKVLEIE